MAKAHWHERWALTIRRDDALDDEYGGGLGGGTTTPPTTTPPAARPTWTAGRLVQPGEVIEPVVENGFQYTAIQAAAAYTGTAEPAWPTTPGGTVVDGGVTWEASAKTSITWTAVPIHKTGAVEPVWPTTAGGTVVDNTITWTARVPYIDDPMWPATKQTKILASKVFKFSVNGDVTRFSKTNDPTDWSAQDDAGFLPTGLHASGDVTGQALGEYRGNLVIWTPTDFILFQVDPDPQQMSHLDTIAGIGTIYYRANASVASDLYFLTQQGVRSVQIASASTNLQDGDVGTPVDSLIKAKLAEGFDPQAFYYVARGEWWLTFGPQVYVFQRSRQANVSAWSRDEYPFPIEEHAELGGALYLRSGNTVLRVDDTVQADAGAAFQSTVWWPWLDMGSPGVTKSLAGVDIVASGAISLQLGWDQTDLAAFTDPLTIGPDTVPGGIIAFPLAGPSFSVKLTCSGAWHLDSAALYLNDFRSGA